MKTLPFTIKAKVVKGKGRGKDLGIQTLNFEVPKDLNLHFGVYAGRLFTNVKTYLAAIHYGSRPVFGEEDISLEAHILDRFNEEMITAELEFIKFIRPIQNFSDTKEMIKRINKDIKEITTALNLSS